MTNIDPSLDTAMNKYCVDIVEFLSPEDISTLLRLRDPDHSLDNRRLALCLSSASPTARGLVLNGLNRFRRPLVEAMLSAWSSECQPSAVEADEAQQRFARCLAYASGAGVIRPPVFPGAEDILVHPRPWPMEEDAATDRAMECFDALAATFTEILRFWLPLHKLMRYGDTAPLEVVFEYLDDYSQALARAFLEDVGLDGFIDKGQALLADLLHRLDAYLERTDIFFQALAGSTTTEALIDKFKESAPHLEAFAVSSPDDNPPCPHLDSCMEAALHVQGLITLHQIARQGGPVALEAYAENTRLGCPVIRGGLIFFTTINDPPALLEIVRRKCRTMRSHWERKAEMLLLGFRTLAEGASYFAAYARMSAYTEECRDVSHYLHDEAEPGMLSRLLKRARSAPPDATQGQGFIPTGADDLTRLSDEDFSELLKECANEDLILCLAFSGDALREKCRRVFTERSFAMLRDEVNAMGSKRRADVEAALMNMLRAAKAYARS